MTKPTHAELTEALGQWAEFVEECQTSGYGLNGDNYTNDLWTREWLEGHIDLLDAAQRSQLAELDKGYSGATTEDDGELLGKHFNIEGLGWWWRRRPNKWGPDLAQDWPELEQGAQSGGD